MQRRLSLALYLLLTRVFLVCAQSVQVNCSSSFNWASNNLGQNTCYIAAFLRAACLPDPASYVFSPPQSGHYGPPVPSKCTCSTVYYSAVSACALCQGQQLLPWSDSITPCAISDVTVGGFPEPIPGNIAVPAWAYLDVTKANTFDVGAAKAYAQTNHTMITNTPPSPPPAPSTSPASSAPPSPPPSSAPPSPPPSSAPAAKPSVGPAAPSSASPPAASGAPSGVAPPSFPNSSVASISPAKFTQSPMPNSSASSLTQTVQVASQSNNPVSKDLSNASPHKSNAGPIVGGVVGGLVVATAVGAAVLFWLRRRGHTRTEMWAAQGGYLEKEDISSRTATPPPMPTSTVGKLYNPDDPSTYPEPLEHSQIAYSGSNAGSTQSGGYGTEV